MRKIVIGITIDHTFRNIYGKILDLYQKFYIDEPEKESVENETEFIRPVLTLPISTNNLMNHIPFESIEDMNDFIFSEFPLEIFGYSKESEPGSVQMFNIWIQDLLSNVDVVLISNEASRTKPATLFFLSKTGFEGNNIKFIDDTIDIWKICDILITSGEAKTKKPHNKKLIIIEKEHNKHLTGNITFKSIFDIFEKENTEKILNKQCSLITKIKKIKNYGISI
jgi:hypothetical protein